MPIFTISWPPVLYFGAILLLAIPLPAGAAAWYKYLQASILHGRRTVFALLFVMTVSYVFLLLGLAAKDLIGPDYSTRRFVTIYLNVGIALFAFVWSALHTNQLRNALLVFSMLVTLAWMYLAIVSATM